MCRRKKKNDAGTKWENERASHCQSAISHNSKTIKLTHFKLQTLVRDHLFDTWRILKPTTSMVNGFQGKQEPKKSVYRRSARMSLRCCQRYM